MDMSQYLLTTHQIENPAEFVEAAVEAFADARNARLESTPSSSPTGQEKVAPVPAQDAKRCPRCQTITANFGKGRWICRPCYSRLVNAKQRQGAKPTVYALVDGQTIIYVGSTTLNLASRLTAHKSAANQGRTQLIARHLRTVNLDDVSIVSLETLPGATTQTLHYCERKWVECLSKTTKLYQSQYLK